MSLAEVKIPADAADQQTTDAKTAVPPVDFIVSLGAGENIIEIYDRQGVQNRLPTASYRVYFLPSEFAPISVGNTVTTPDPVVYGTKARAAGQKVASLVADVKAPGFGTVLKVTDSVNFGKRGFYYCVAVNRAGVEAPVEHMVRTDSIQASQVGNGVTISSGGGGTPVGPAISVETSYGGGATITGTIDGVNTSFTMATAFATYDVVFVDGIIDIGASAIGLALTTATPPISTVTVEHLG